MSDTALSLVVREPLADFLPLQQLVVDSVSSPLTRVKYTQLLTEFFGWWQGAGEPAFSRATVQAHRASLLEKGLAPSSINQRLSSIRRLAREAAANGLLSHEAAHSIVTVPSVPQRGVRMGNWLTKQETQKLLDAPPENTLKGQRDRAVLALLVACGLRRSELAALTVEHIQQREGRWVILDLRGKHGRIRTVPLPAGVKVRIDNWCAAAGIESGRIIRSMNRHGRVVGDSITPGAILGIVAEYHNQAKPHDLRRTCAKLCRKAGGELEQVQLLLGHASIATTERYLGTQLDLEHAANDRLGLKFL